MFFAGWSLGTRILLAMLVAALGCAPSEGQTPPTAPPAPDAPEVTSHEGQFTFSSRVNLVSVPVVVRDRNGRAIGNLRQEDFQLFDKGKLQTITRFSIEKSGSAAIETAPPTPSREQTPGAPIPAPSVLPEHYVAYLFDDVHLKAGDLLQTRQAVNRHLDEALDPTTRAAIFTTSGRMLTDFTADRVALHKAVNSVLPYTSGIDPEQDCPPVSYYMADLLVNQYLYLDGVLFSDAQLAQMILSGTADQSLTAIVNEAAACSHLPLNPPQGGPTPITSDLTPEPLIILVRTTVRQVLTYGDHETSSVLGALRDVVRRISIMPGSRTLVLASPGFLLTRDHRSDEYDVLDRAIRANVTVNTIDMRGLYTMPGSDASERGHLSASGGLLTQAEISAASQADDVLAEVADGTGGKFFHNDNDLKQGLNLLAARPEFVYVLGFSPQNLKFDGSYHNLKVAVKNASGMSLQVRRGYWAPNHEVDPAEQAREEIREAVFSREEVRDIPMNVQTEFFDSGGDKFELTVSARMDVNDLKFRKAGDRNIDTLTVVAGLFDPDGNYVSGIQRVLDLHLRDRTIEAIQKAGINVKESFNVSPGRYIVRVVVRDSEGKTMAARNGGVQIP